MSQYWSLSQFCQCQVSRNTFGELARHDNFIFENDNGNAILLLKICFELDKDTELTNRPDRFYLAW